ncbi:hypothetical protein P8452_19356 [Trifolium repens]|nr:hypothetical protein P8452_19356 [Trifolium repens]
MNAANSTDVDFLLQNAPSAKVTSYDELSKLKETMAKLTQLQNGMKTMLKGLRKMKRKRDNDDEGEIGEDRLNIDLRLMASSAKYSLFLLDWLVELANVESMTLSSPTLQVLFLVPNLLKVELPSLCNLKLIKVV